MLQKALFFQQNSICPRCHRHGATAGDSKETFPFSDTAGTCSSHKNKPQTKPCQGGGCIFQSWCWSLVCSWFVEIHKPRLRELEEQLGIFDSAFQTLHSKFSTHFCTVSPGFIGWLQREMEI